MAQKTVGAVTGATAGAAALTTIIFWLLTLLGVEAPNEVQGAVTTLIVVVAGWLVPPKHTGDHVADQ